MDEYSVFAISNDYPIRNEDVICIVLYVVSIRWSNAGTVEQDLPSNATRIVAQCIKIAPAFTTSGSLQS